MSLRVLPTASAGTLRERAVLLDLLAMSRTSTASDG